MSNSSDSMTQDRTPVTINEWAEEAQATVKARGFYEDEHGNPIEPNIPEAHGNLVEECSEIWTAYRENKLNKPCDKTERIIALGIDPVGLTCLEEELADIVLRVCCDAKDFGVDLERAMRIKNAYNKTRSHQHGGRRC